MELRTPPLFACSFWGSANGIPDSDGASLVSLFKLGTVGAVVDLIKDATLGPCDILRLSRLSVSTRCKLRRCLAGTGRFVAAPGRDGALEKLADFDSLGFGGDITMGPPSLRLIASHRSGRRAEKLLWISIPGFKSSRNTHKGAITSTQKSLKVLSPVLLVVMEPGAPSLLDAFTISLAIDCQIHKRSM